MTTELKYGPQTREIEALIETVGSLDADQIDALQATWNVEWDASRDAARTATWNVAWDTAWNEARDTTRGTTRSAVWDEMVDVLRSNAWVAASLIRGAAWDAVAALLVRDLIGDSFSQSDYDTLTTSWRTVIGPIHPDDIDLRENNIDDVARLKKVMQDAGRVYGEAYKAYETARLATYVGARAEFENMIREGE